MKTLKYLSLLFFLLVYSCTNTGERPIRKEFNVEIENGSLEKAVFAGGCFWCMEAPFEKVEGVLQVLSGYTGGEEINPTYEAVSSGSTGHLEAIEVTYDPKKVSYQTLLNYYWRQIDPTDVGGSFVDRGPQYRSAIFYATDEQKQMAIDSKKQLDQSGRYDKAIVVEVLKGLPFYPAEEYHQDFYEKSPLRYKIYRGGSGRDQYLKTIWQDEAMTTRKVASDQKTSTASLKERLTPLQYKVTQKEGTEPPFDNLYWNNKEEGIYVDIVSGAPLFSSLDKFDSKTGWPSFTRAIQSDVVVEKKDRALFMVRIEIRSKEADSHLGHLFDDGPEPTGLRYCINSAALRFIPKADLQKEGYEKFLTLFPDA